MITSLLLLAIACAVATWTLAVGKIFSTPRTLVKELSPFVHEGLSCPYCLSHWIVLISLVCHPSLRLHLSGNTFIGFLDTWFFTLTITVLVLGLLKLFFPPSIPTKAKPSVKEAESLIEKRLTESGVPGDRLAQQFYDMPEERKQALLIEAYNNKALITGLARYLECGPGEIWSTLRKRLRNDADSLISAR